MAAPTKTSSDEANDFDMVEYPPNLKPLGDGLSPRTLKGRRRGPLTEEEFQGFFDSDGRLLREQEFREAVFRGGIHPKIRKEAWKYLFGIYPFNSTPREREVTLSELYLKYRALKNRWKKMLLADQTVDDDKSAQKLLCPAYVEQETYHACRPSDLDELPDKNRMIEEQAKAEADYEVASSRVEFPPRPSSMPSPDVQQQMVWGDIQAKMYAARQPICLSDLITSIKVIDKDVPRTDRDSDYFRGFHNPHLHMLRDVLITFTAFHPVTSYAQGMNDILSRFLVVMDSEVESYWCFKNFIQTIAEDFTEDGLVEKLVVVRRLLREIDEDLWKYLEMLQIGDMTFCHRWMLLSFKREFNFLDAIRCFEMINSRHMELSSPEAEKIRSEKRRLEFQSSKGETRVEEAPIKTEFTFDVFMCVSLLVDNREYLFKCNDPADVVQYITSLTNRIELDDFMVRAESLFSKYVLKAESEHYSLLELPSPEKSQEAEEAIMHNILSNVKDIVEAAIEVVE